MKDPVCGMSVDEATAAAAWEHDGIAYSSVPSGACDGSGTIPAASCR